MNNIVAHKAESGAADGIKSLSRVADVTKPEEIGNRVARGLQEFGKLDVLVKFMEKNHTSKSE
jgi:hypothetical protein